jgi:hypothetical protein
VFEAHETNHCIEFLTADRGYWKTQACAAVKHMMELTSFLRHIMTLGLLRGSARLRDDALRILDGFESSDYNHTDLGLTVIKLDEPSLEYAAKWIENSLIGETNERVIEFGKNMAMSIRAAKPLDEDDTCPEYEGSGQVAGAYFADDGIATCDRCKGKGTT